MAGPDRMTTEEVVRKVLLDEHADVLRESLNLLVCELVEIEVSELIGAELGERRPDDRGDAPQRLPRAALGHARRRDRAADPSS